MKVIILGAGLVGGAMAIDLTKDLQFEVTAVDHNPKVLEGLRQHSIITATRDLSRKKNVQELIEQYDLVVNAVPGHMGFSILRTVIESRKNIVDIAFFPEDPFLLDDLAKSKGVTAIVDCGVCPGVSNMLIGHLDRQMELDSILFYVGGLPTTRHFPFEYKAGFSPMDVIEEYVRPARMVNNYDIVSRPPLSDVELIDFPEVGTLEAFNSDGVRSLIRTIKARHIQEKTLRYPGHSQKISLLKEIGFFNQERLEVNNKKVSPRDLTAKLLFPIWEMKKGDEDMTVFKLVVKGKKEGKNVEIIYNLVDRYDPETHTTSMARTTGYTATAAVRMLSQKLFKRKGICPPEYIGQETQCVEFMLEKLRERNIIYTETQKELVH